MAERAGGHGAGEHRPAGHETGARPDAGHAASEHRLGEMDIAEQRRMFDSFIRFWVFVFGGSALILIFLALFNS